MSIKFKAWLDRIVVHQKRPLPVIPKPLHSVLYSDKTNYTKIIEHYASLIATMLWSAFANLTRNDLSESSSFARPEKASPALRHYFNIYSTLQLFIKNNLGDEADDQTRVIAFRKWLDAADVLEQNQCFDGFWLVLIALILAQNDTLRAQLPAEYNKKLDEYMALSSPLNNYANLRNRIAKGKGGFYPVFLWFKDLTLLDAWDENDQSHNTMISRQKESLLDTIEQFVSENRPKPDGVTPLFIAHTPVAGEQDAWNLIELIRLDLINHFIQNEIRSTGWFGGESRTIDGITYKIPFGIAQIYDKLSVSQQGQSSPHELLNEIRRIVASRQETSHTFFNRRQTVTQQFYQQCSESIDCFFETKPDI
ncbi:RasGEF domain-containing protein [Legionella shakespearei]|uniref:RasGEF domain protein n=1 Tax=Legionella shakespearei DSM 23087 TaxID=1122169 RepID=A0A0W0YKH0_9GAMM|nr:RasGEF domain-containing protein [Legionella shakespearei]KTD57291.1 RasGEF domain protein [Legionella shakespearei DSM 23087]